MTIFQEIVEKIDLLEQQIDRLSAVETGTSASSVNDMKVSEVWESDLGAVALQADAAGQIGIGIGASSPNEKVEVKGNILIRDPMNNGALIISPTSFGYGVDPEFRIQSAEISDGNDAVNFIIARNAKFRTSDDTYQYIDDVGEVASIIRFPNTGDIVFGTAASGTGTVTFTDYFLVTNAGKVFINESANANMTLGLTIMQDAADDEALAVKASPVAHGMTDEAETDTFGTSKKADVDAGGLEVRGYRDADGANSEALRLTGSLGEAVDTGKTTSSNGVVSIVAQVKSGTGVTSVGADGNLLSLKNDTTTKLIVDAEGTIHQIPGSDIDIDLIEVQVTDVPTVGWDESEDMFAMSKGLAITADGGNDSGLRINNSNEQLNAFFEDDSVGADFLMSYLNSGGADIAILSNGDVQLARSGNVLIGANITPLELLHVYGGNVLIDRGATVSGLSRTLTIGGARTSAGTNYASIDFQNYDGADYIGARIASRNDGGVSGGDLRLATYNGTLTTQVVLTKDGDLGINGVTSPSTEFDIGAGAMEFAEMTAPGAGAVNTCRLYTEDDGAGKTRLMAIFNTGAAQQIAIQP